MSSSFTYRVWTCPDPKGRARLALLAVADCANHMGVAEASVRTIAAMIGEDKNAAHGLINGLCEGGYLRRVSEAKGAIPARYQVVVSDAVPARPVAEVSDMVADATPPDGRDTKAETVTELPRASMQAAPKVVQVELHGQIGGAAKPKVSPVAPIVAREAAPSTITQADVAAILTAAGVTASLEKPLYWARREHRDDLAALMQRTGQTVEALCMRLRRAVADGRSLDRPARRLADLERLLGLPRVKP